MKTFFIFTITILLASCSTIGEKKVGQATLQNQYIEENGKRYSYIFTAVNGEKLKLPNFGPPKNDHFIDPGKKSIDLEVNFKLPETAYVHWSTKFKGIFVELKENETYKIKSSINNWCVKLEIINSSGVVVAGPLYSQPGVKDGRLHDTIDDIKFREAVTYFRTQTCP
jgi:hypothetical protein